MKNVISVFKREFKAYFDSPVAYVFLTAFLVLTGFLTFAIAQFYEARQADLGSFFFWHPWVYLLLVPAATMGLWADERRSGTAELVLTLPLTTTEVLVGKFLASWAFLVLALALTFPVAVTVGYLGSPDWGAIVCGYVGSALLAGAAAAVGLFASSLSRSSVVGFVVALALVFLLLIIGFDPVVGALAAWGFPNAVVNALAGCSLLTHFMSLQRGVLDISDVGYYVGIAALFIAAAKTAVDGRRGASKGLVALAAIAVIVVAAVTLLGRCALRADLTAEGLYTLSGGSKAVLAQLDKDVTLKYYVSEDAEEMPQVLKAYAKRVGDLLDEYVRASGGRLVLEKYDPEPDSDAEEWAQRYGIEQQTVNPFGAGIYFGLVATCGDREETIGAFTPRTESTLEYDLTRLVTRVAWPERPVVGVMSSLPNVVGGQPDRQMMMMGQRPQQGWIVFQELAKDYDVRTVETDSEAIDDDVKTLVVVHPEGLTDKALYAIDQFVLRGGRLVACVDPFSVTEAIAASQNQQAMMMGMGPKPSTLGRLFEAWGIGFDTMKVTCDLSAATQMGNGRGGAELEPAVLSFKPGNMAKGELLAEGMDNVIFAYAGAFTYQKKDMDLLFDPIITTSEDKSSEAMASMLMMGGGTKEARPDGKSRIVAARLTGTFRTAYPKGPDGTNDVSKALSEGKGTVMLFADSDFLTDQLTVRVLRTPFGNVAQPVSDNLGLFSNVIEQFAGREELIGLRTRGASSRPFDVVDRLEADAMAKWQQKEADLQEKLRQAQARINELQSKKSGEERMILSREQQEEIVKAREAAADTRKQLKEVRKDLTADIRRLGTEIKWMNIALVPLLVVLFGLFHGARRMKGRK